jgi:hypothetical protein
MGGAPVPRSRRHVVLVSLHRTRPDAGWVNGKLAACRYCGGPIPSGRRTFCSGQRGRFRRDRGVLRFLVLPGGCVHEFCVRSNAAYARKCVEVRDGRVCAVCGVMQPRDGWQADHIVPVSRGGGETGLYGLRTLCTEHHRVETKKLAQERAAERRAKRC